MKILMMSHVFYPGVGGIETVSRLLAEEFHRAGHQVRVVTPALSNKKDEFPYEVHRGPTKRTLLQDHAWCDVCFHNNISLNVVWPLLFYRRPWVVAHHVWIGSADTKPHWRERLKLWSLRFAKNLAVSRAVAARLPVRAEIVGNPYDDDVFYEATSPTTKRDLIFSGRLVSDKGADLILTALGKLKAIGMTPQLTIVGDGPEKKILQEMTAKLGLERQVVFAGLKPQKELADLLRDHRIQIIPSRWSEPFGLVALEALACGCQVIIAESGGLMEAAGDCAVTFKINDAHGLADAIAKLLSQPDDDPQEREKRIRHLRQFQKATVAQKYLAAFDSASGSILDK